MTEVPCRRASTVDRGEPIAPGDPRFSDGVVIITDANRYFAHFRETLWTWDPRGSPAGPDPVRATDAVQAVARRMAGNYDLSLAIVDGADAPLGVLGWDDLVRFALAHGSQDACWRASSSTATRPNYAITPVANAIPLGRPGPHTLEDAAVAIVQRATRHLGTQNDAIQFILPGGIGSPADLLRAIFA